MLDFENKGPEAIETGLEMLFDNLHHIAPDDPVISPAVTSMAHRLGEAADFISARASFDKTLFVKKSGEPTELSKAMKTVIAFRENWTGPSEGQST